MRSFGLLASVSGSWNECCSREGARVKWHVKKAQKCYVVAWLSMAYLRQRYLISCTFQLQRSLAFALCERSVIFQVHSVEMSSWSLSGNQQCLHVVAFQAFFCFRNFLNMPHTHLFIRFQVWWTYAIQRSISFLPLLLANYKLMISIIWTKKKKNENKFFLNKCWKMVYFVKMSIKKSQHNQIVIIYLFIV